MIRAIALLLCFLVGGAKPAVAGSSTEAPLIVPPTIHDYAVSQGCVPPANFYRDMPDATGAPFVYGVHTKAPYRSFAVYCKVPGEADFTLLFNFAGQETGPARCPDRIQQRPWPGSLSVREPRSWEKLTGATQSLMGYRYVEGDAPVDPDRGPISDLVIVSSGTPDSWTTYYCLDGKWIYESVH